MNYKFFGILPEFDKYKSFYDFSDYINDMRKIETELNCFNRYSAEQLVKELTTKYSLLLTDIGFKLNTGRSPSPITKDNTVSKINSQKSEEQLKEDLLYIYNCIPLIALIKIGVKKLIFGGVL